MIFDHLLDELHRDFTPARRLFQKTLALLSRERMSMFPEIPGKELSSIARRSFCFPMHSLRCRSRGNANEEAIVRNASRPKLGRPLLRLHNAHPRTVTPMSVRIASMTIIRLIRIIKEQKNYRLIVYVIIAN